MILSFSQRLILDTLLKENSKPVTKKKLAKMIWKGMLPKTWQVMLAQEIMIIRNRMPAMRKRIQTIRTIGYQLL